jgi:hypothetical protein
VLLCNCQVRPSFVLFEYPCATKSINVIEPTIRTSFQDSQVHHPSKQRVGCHVWNQLSPSLLVFVWLSCYKNTP